MWALVLCKLLSLQRMAHMEAQWLSGRLLHSRPRDRGFEPHCVVFLEQDIYPSLALVQPSKTRPCLTERLLMRRNKQTKDCPYVYET